MWPLGTVTWTATFTGQVRVLVDQYFCTNRTTCAPLGSPAPPRRPVTVSRADAL